MKSDYKKYFIMDWCGMKKKRKNMWMYYLK